MIWFSALLFVAIGVYLIIRRHESADAQSIMMGATMKPGCIVAEGIFFLLLAVVFVVLYKMEWMGN